MRFFMVGNDLGDKKGIRIENVTKKFGNVTVLESVSLHVKEGEFLSLLGPSGCGKTTTLRMIAGFAKPDEGTIHVQGEEVTHLPPFKRNIGLIFQNYALWPHMTVFENIAFGLKLKNMKPGEIKRIVGEVISLTNLSGLEERFPRELSGGQQQRVALARVLALKPTTILLDEPLSNLDKKLRVYMRVELRQLQKKFNMTALYVTHDQEEALSMSDRVAIMDRGKIIEVGTPDQIYENFKDSFVADFVGNINFMEGKILEVSGGNAVFETREGLILRVPFQEGFRAEGQFRLGIRPERINISREFMEGDNIVLGEVKFMEYLGSLTRYHVELDKGYLILVESQNLDLKLSAGERVYIGIASYHCHFIRS